MTCPRCHAENRDGLRFCEDCGSRLTLTCAQCGGDLAPGKRFCGSCGTPATSQPAAPTASPESYTPKHLAEKILTSKSALEGERKQVTVLFADLKGSMELLADRDPDEARKLLDPVLQIMMDAVHRYEGTVNQVMGDGIMALLGAPLSHEDHAVRACYAALRMQESVKRYAEEVRRTVGIPIQIRVGLNSGEVVVRSIGSDLRMDYTAVGQTTHLAARMEQMAMPGSILIAQETLNLAEGYVVVKPLGPMLVKGLEAPIEVYEVTGAATVRSRLHAAAARGLTRFVGRTSELEQLRQALDDARSGRGQVVAVVGEPGVGKSRLYWEFTHSHRTQNWLIVESGSASYGKATAFLPIIDLLRAYFQIETRDEPRKIREKVTGKLLSLDRALEPSLPALLWLLDVSVDDPYWQRLDPPQRRLRTLDAVKRLLLRESQVQPLLVLFEDLHWIDAETQASLDGLIESLPTARVLLLVNYRPEYQHAWGRKPYYRQLRIDPLPPESADALLDALLGEDRTLGPLKRVLIARTEGNPFFLEESVRTLVETTVLVGERGAYRMTKAPDAWQIPATAQAILAARIDRLASEDKRLLQAASVIGKDVPFALLQAIADMPEGSLRGGLTHLQAAEFLYETSLFPDLEYTFKHAFTHGVAYGSLLQERRRALHARAAAAIEALYPERLTEHVERLAHHALRGELWDKAVLHLRQAGGKAMERSAYREAAAGFEQALDALRHLPESPERTEQAIDLHLDAGGVLVAPGELAKSTDHVREAEALAESLRDERRLGQALVLLATLAWLWGDLDRGLELGQRALAIALGLHDVSLQRSANYTLGVIGQARGDYRQSVAALSQVAEALQGSRRSEWLDAATSGDAPDLAPQLSGDLSLLAEQRLEEEVVPRRQLVVGDPRGRLAWSLAELGEFTGAMARGEEAVRLARDDSSNLILAYRNLGIVFLRRGALPQAIPLLERAVKLCRVTQVRYLFDTTAGHLGYAYALSGRLPEGVILMEEALADPAATGTVYHPLLLAYLGEAHLMAGRRDDACAVARRALDLAHRQTERGHEAWVLRLLGEIATQADLRDLGSAEEHYGRALARATELDMRPLVAHCHLGLGQLYRQTGDRAKAAEHLTTARAMYREMDMGFWLAQAEAACAGGDS
jgi:class 3 adenylate cyclase/tetratricopeptide (TPR) repeat protein